MKITAKTHQGGTVEQEISEDECHNICAFITNSDYIISNEDRLKIAEWETANFIESLHIPFFAHYGELEELKSWIAQNVHGRDCKIYIFTGGASHPNETPYGEVKIFKEETIKCR